MKKPNSDDSDLSGGSLKFRDKKRFSTYLMTTFVVLVTLSVVILLATIYRYSGKKVESEFYEKLQAQKGQVEIILKNRIALITGKLDNLGSDNIVRVTVMLDDKSKLENRITQFYPPEDGVYHFVKKIGEKSIVPQNYPGISRQVIDFVLTEYPNGEVLEDGEKRREYGKGQYGLPLPDHRGWNSRCGW